MDTLITVSKISLASIASCHLLKLGVLGNVSSVILHDIIDLCVLHNKGQVCIGAFIANKPLFAFQHTVNDADDTFELAGMAGLGPLQLLRV